jgi:hypothetical protein
MWIVIDYALPTGDNVPSTQGLQSVLAEKFSSTLSQHSNFRVELIDHLQAEAFDDKIRLRFRALDPSRKASEDHQFLRQLLSELQELSTKSDLAIKVGGSADILLQPIPSSVRQIPAPDGPLASSTSAPTKQGQEGGSGDGSKLTATVVPIVIVAVFVIAALLLLQQRRMAQLRRRYLRLEGKLVVGAVLRFRCFALISSAVTVLLRRTGTNLSICAPQLKIMVTTQNCWLKMTTRGVPKCWLAPVAVRCGLNS